MPNKNTFEIKPIKLILDKYVGDGVRWIDPFAGVAGLSPAAITNDLNPDAPTMYHEDAIDFLKKFDSVKGVIYDPPYSVRQVSELYKSIGRKVTQETTRANFWTKIKKEIGRIIEPGGTVISFGWNTGGIGKVLGFEIVEILLVPHGGIHNDTICTVERKH